MKKIVFLSFACLLCFSAKAQDTQAISSSRWHETGNFPDTGIVIHVQLFDLTPFEKAVPEKQKEKLVRKAILSTFSNPDLFLKADCSCVDKLSGEVVWN